MQSYTVDRINFSAAAMREGMLDFMVKNKKTLAIMQNSQFPDVSFTDNS